MEIGYIGPWTLVEGIERAMPEAQSKVLMESIGSSLQTILSLILYLCSEEPEIESKKQSGERPSYPKYTQTKKGLRLFPAEKPRIWNVGNRIGKKLKNAEFQSDQEGIRSIKPHLR